MNVDDFPRNLLQFEERFATEAACLSYLRELKWPDGFSCSRCGGTSSWTIAARRVEECAVCGAQESVTAGTMFHRTRKPLRLWFRAITLFVTSKRGLSAMELSRQLDIHYETAWTWCHKLRAAVGRAFGKERLEGVVELDETYLGGTDDRSHKGRSIAGKKAIVAGAVEVHGEHLGRIRLEATRSAAAGNLIDFAKRNIAQHSVARTDGLSSYAGLVAAGIGHQRIVIGKDVKLASAKFPAIHRVFSLLKRTVLGTFHGSVSHKHLPAYLAEFDFRFNRRASGSRWLLFRRILEAAPAGHPPTMAQLTQHLVGT